MQDWVEIDPSIRLDQRTERKNESHQHWAIKAALIDRLRSDSAYVGEIDDERKTEDLIGDIRCKLSKSPSDVPERFVIEVQTNRSDKDVVDATRRHLRFGFAVYWVYQVDAANKRREAEAALSKCMSAPPSLGVASLPEGELRLGSPIMWDEFEMQSPKMSCNELYVPTYARSAQCFNHGVFTLDGHRFTIYRFLDRDALYVSWHGSDGQQTLPQTSPWSWPELSQRLKEGELSRISPVAGRP